MKSGQSISLGRVTHDYEYKYNNLWDAFFKINPTATDVNYENFHGWMDEYKVFSYEPDLETSCNFANGTLVSPGNDAALNALANTYTQAMHDKVTAQLRVRGQTTYPKYACYTGTYGTENMAALTTIPTGAVSLRDAVHFPEGPIFRDKPRPDSTTNTFCLSCHTNDSIVSGLSVNALKYQPLEARLDPRRQPSQPPALITGNISNEFLIKSNADATSLGSNFIDDYILSRAPAGYVTVQYPVGTVASMSKTTKWGGTGGVAFDHTTSVPAAGLAYLNSMSLYSYGTLINGLAMYAVDNEGKNVYMSKGTPGGTVSTLTLVPGEYLQKAEIPSTNSSTAKVTYLKLTTNLNRSISAGTAPAGGLITINAPTGHQLISSFGNSSPTHIDALGFIIMPLK
jgi:hypothetical protein